MKSQDELIDSFSVQFLTDGYSNADEWNGQNGTFGVYILTFRSSGFVLDFHTHEHDEDVEFDIAPNGTLVGLLYTVHP